MPSKFLKHVLAIFQPIFVGFGYGYPMYTMNAKSKLPPPLMAQKQTDLNESHESTKADFNDMYTKKAESYDKYRAPAPGVSHILKCLWNADQALPMEAAILDLGCGTGSFFQYLDALQPKKLIGTDINARMAEKAFEKAKEFMETEKRGKKKIEVLTGDAEGLLRDGYLQPASFDLIFCGQVLQNLTKDPAEAFAKRKQFYANIMQLLKPGGKLVLTTRLVPTGGRLSNQYWYADPSVVPEAVAAFEAAVPANPTRELIDAGFEFVHSHASTDTVVRADTYYSIQNAVENIKDFDFRAADSFFQWVEKTEELGKIIKHLERLEENKQLAAYVRGRLSLSSGLGHVVVVEAQKPPCAYTTTTYCLR